MTKHRLEAFSDGVIAIILTIMVLELKPPHGLDQEALRPLRSAFISYVISFAYVGIYWNNHHHLMHAVDKVNGSVMWMNLLLLFFLSLFPFCTAWVGESHFAPLPVFAYGAALTLAAVSYFLLARHLALLHGPKSALAKALGKDFKGKVSIAVYVLGMALAFPYPKAAYAMYAAVALMWIVPDRRFAR